MTQERKPQRNKFLTIQVARGLAALIVAFYHGSNSIKVALAMPVHPFGILFQFGHAGVDFFFVLSGFIIFHVHRNDINRPDRLSEFAWKRITRIYPLFWFIMIFITAKFIALGDFKWMHFAKTIFLLPQPPLPMLMQSWTLVHEQLFYLFFGLTIFNMRFAIFASALWLCGFAASPLVNLPSSGTVRDIIDNLWSTYNLEFLVGILVAWLHLKDRRIDPWLTMTSGLAIFSATAIADNYQYFSSSTNASILLYGASSGMIILGSVTAEARGMIRLGSWAEIMGDVSYPLYLVHGIVISITTTLLSKLYAKGLPASAILITAVIGSCIVAYLLNRFIERPIARHLRKFWKERH